MHGRPHCEPPIWQLLPHFRRFSSSSHEVLIENCNNQFVSLDRRIAARIRSLMGTSSASGSLPQQPSISGGGAWSKIAAYLVRRRVRITVIIFVALMAEDVLIGVRPHPIFNIRDPKSVVGLLLVFTGLAVRSWAAGVLHKTRELTTTGPYAVIRNPLYVGSFLIMAGFATLIDDVENIYIILGPLAGLYFLQVLHEERVLSEKYESRWQEYASAVPRFIPRRIPSPRSMFATWQRHDWVGSREYRAMGAVLAGIAAIEIWRHLK
jgi:protein-S-isoprenylcysteine O-methyltransferase Ste14